MSATKFSTSELESFLDRASLHTYQAGAPETKNPERKEFHELVYEEKNFSYRDSYIGNYRSWGTELVRFKGTPVWNMLYGGGLTAGKEKLDQECFKFLKFALTQKPLQPRSFRGPNFSKDGSWTYSYVQTGDITNFSGYEEIKLNEELVFWHRVIGGIIR